MYTSHLIGLLGLVHLHIYSLTHGHKIERDEGSKAKKKKKKKKKLAPTYSHID